MKSYHTKEDKYTIIEGSIDDWKDVFKTIMAKKHAILKISHDDYPSIILAIEGVNRAALISKFESSQGEPKKPESRDISYTKAGNIIYHDFTRKSSS